MDLSVILPIHNEQERIIPAITQLIKFLPQTGLTWEILMIENGSTDRTVEIAAILAEMLDNVYDFNIPERGKGAAVRDGMITARGDWRLMCDCDFSMPVNQITKLLDVCQWADIVIGTRKRTGEPLQRRISAAVFRMLVELLVPLDLLDTQSGFKLFSARAAQACFSQQTISGLAFDVEVLKRARDLDLTIAEVPVSWYYDPDSRIRLVSDSLQMARDLWRIRAHRTAQDFERVTISGD